MEMAASVDTDSAVLALDKISGHQRLVTTAGMFVPRAYEEILEVICTIIVHSFPDSRFILSPLVSCLRSGSSSMLAHKRQC
eukprot:2016918-Amphidinium_carterae.2